jgi:hypothetical protein
MRKAVAATLQIAAKLWRVWVDEEQRGTRRGRCSRAVAPPGPGVSVAGCGVGVGEVDQHAGAGADEAGGQAWQGVGEVFDGVGCGEFAEVEQDERLLRGGVGPTAPVRLLRGRWLWRVRGVPRLVTWRCGRGLPNRRARRLR